MAEERAWSQRFGECGGGMGKKAAGEHAGLYVVVRQRSTGCHKKQGCFLCSLPGDLEV